jgi:muramidase (phage lysozyme)
MDLFASSDSATHLRARQLKFFARRLAKAKRFGPSFQGWKLSWSPGQYLARAMGLTDFSPHTQDLMAVDILRTLGVIDKIKAGDIPGAMPKAATRWAALPEGPGKANHYPPQPYVEYSAFLASYKSAGGTVK